MENRDRDKVSQSSGSKPAGDINRKAPSQQGQPRGDSSAEFGQKIGRSENELNELNEPNRKSGSVGSSGMKSENGRSSGSSSYGGSSGSKESSGLNDDSTLDSNERGSVGSRH